MQARRGEGDQPVDDVTVAQGGRFGGWSLDVKNGKPTFTYNYLGIHRYTGTATVSIGLE